MSQEVKKKAPVEPFRWFHIIYGSNDNLLNCQDFERDYSSYEPDVYYSQVTRCILLGMNLILLGVQKYYGITVIFSIYFSQWSLLISTISCALSVYIIHARNDLNLLALHHICYTMSLLMNLLTVIVYWNLMHDTVLKKFEDDWEKQLIECYLCHIIPAFACFLNTILTNSVLKMRLLGPFLVMGVLFIISNWAITTSSGTPIYPILPWDPFHQSLSICIGFLFGMTICYVILVKADEYIKDQFLIKVFKIRDRRKAKMLAKKNQ